ncbi:MAG: [FeFe] hydrogenase H-cluster radical SAM maturase HydE [Lachnospiraceae bacterium]|nr:[FeFe] hydrogenase H-cluster radical SAM maturase HydE [Lachnospiraceae bacterium]
MNNQALIRKLNEEHSLELAEWEQLLSSYTKEDLDHAMKMAQEIAVAQFGKKIYFRGIIEFSNFCKNDCYYCGIRKSNKECSRYRLELEDILTCCVEGYKNGFRTFVLQGGEDGWFTDERMCEIVKQIKSKYPDCAVTLSLGERSFESYKALKEAGADRYLLRHETADEEHYRALHPEYQTLENRMRCLKDLKSLGYQSGCGIMVGTPGQTPKIIAKDMKFMEEFQPEMIGVGPFLPHKDTPFRGEKKGSVELTLFILALCRIMLPQVLLPSTTALGTAEADGRKQGVLAGCNVVMPNLSPLAVRKKYMLYDEKAGTDISAAEGIALLKNQMEEIGYEVVVGRGDFGKER